MSSIRIRGNSRFTNKILRLDTAYVESICANYVGDNLLSSKAEKILLDNDIFYENIGTTQEEYLEIEGELKMSNKDLFKINNEWYNNY